MLGVFYFILFYPTSADWHCIFLSPSGKVTEVRFRLESTDGVEQRSQLSKESELPSCTTTGVMQFTLLELYQINVMSFIFHPMPR